VIFNLPGYRVIDAVDLPLGSRRVKVEPVDLADGCPVWGGVGPGARLGGAAGS
jgi:transposase